MTGLRIPKSRSGRMFFLVEQIFDCESSHAGPVVGSERKLDDRNELRGLHVFRFDDR